MKKTGEETHMGFVRVGLMVALALDFVGAPAASQPAHGELTGVVRISGDVFPGVMVVAAAPSHRGSFVAVSERDGRYHLPGLPAGNYTVSFRADGCLEVAREGVLVDEGKPAVLDVTLSAGHPAPGPHFGGPLIPDERRDSDPLLRPTIPVRLETPFGDIDLAVDTVDAPITATNFLRYVDGGFYDGGRFHRTTRPDTYNPVLPNRPPMALIQASINPARRPGFPPIPLERTSVTGLKHVVGAVSMARTGPDTATSDFCILLNDQSSLDFGGKRFDDGQGAAAFGRVSAGLDVVKAIQQQPVSERQPTTDNPLTHTQNLTPPVPITKACRFAREWDDISHLVSKSRGCAR